MKAFTLDITALNRVVISPGILVQEYYKKNKKHYGLPILRDGITDFFPLMNVDETMPKVLMQAVVQYEDMRPTAAMYESIERCSESDKAFLYFSPECMSQDIKCFTSTEHGTNTFVVRAPTIMIIPRDQLVVVSLPMLQKDMPYMFDGNTFNIKLQ